MQIRRPQQQQYHKYYFFNTNNNWRWLLFVPLFLVLIYNTNVMNCLKHYLFASFSNSSNNNNMLTNQNGESYTPPRIYYNIKEQQLQKQKPGMQLFIRYEAIEEYQDGSKYPISVARWAEIMATSSDNNNNNNNNNNNTIIEIIWDFVQVLQNAPFQAFYFETKGVNPSNATLKNFEFVLVDAPQLYQFANFNPDYYAFSEHFTTATDAGFIFSNLGGSATLVAPNNQYNNKQSLSFGHLAAFVRNASREQIVQVFQMTCNYYYNQIAPTFDNNNNNNTKTVWFSTSGTGVAWLHFRFDSRPKYYTYMPFKKET